MRRGRVKGPYGSHDRPASALRFRLVLAVFGALVLAVGTALALLWVESVPLAVVLAAGFLAALLNVYWVLQRLWNEG